MKFVHKGWLRLWIVVTVLAVPTFAEIQFMDMQKTWASLDQMTIKRCVDEEWSLPSHPDALECGRDSGTFKTVFERENTTPLAYWAEALGVGLLLDLVITTLLVLAFLATRWIWRGFKIQRGTTQSSVK